MKQSLYSLEPDDYFVLNGEMIEGRGEDSFYAACTPYTAVSAVFDGCGGIGSKKYSRFSGFSGAYMSSRAISGAMHDWFHDFDGGISLDSQEIGTTMKAYFRDAVKLLHRIGDEPSRIAGMLVRDFPSTAAVALVRKTEKGIELHCLWAGDSRIYLLDGQGLAQLTTDDIADRDAMHNLRADGARFIVGDATGSLWWLQTGTFPFITECSISICRLQSSPRQTGVSAICPRPWILRTWYCLLYRRPMVRGPLRILFEERSWR